MVIPQFALFAYNFGNFIKLLIYINKVKSRAFSTGGS